MAKRAIILGLDALVTPILERFLEEEELPNFAKLLERGCLTRIRPTVPAQTPTNWATIATGATPGNHGVVTWGSHLPGEPVSEDHREAAFAAGLCRAEYLWEALARQGQKSIVMNYAGYPPTTDKALFIDWLYQPVRSYFDLAPPTVYHNCPELNTTDPIAIHRAEDWINLPASSRPHLEFKMEVVPSTEGNGPQYYGLIFAERENYNRVLVAGDKDGSEPCAVLATGEWSEWVREAFESMEMGPVEGAFKFKLLELSGDGRRLQLYRTDVFPTDGRHFSDEEVGRKIISECGPYVHSAQTCSLHCRGWVDWETTDETMRAEAEWWADAAKRCVEETGASLLILHWHNLDSMGHTFVPRVDPTGTSYGPEAVEENWENIRNYYRAADRFVGEFLRRFDDGETLFCVVSDHGMPANKKAVSLINFFKQKDWINIEDGEVNWAKSKLWISQNHLWINLEGRNEGGIVPQEDYKKLRGKVRTAMKDIKDPETGRHVFSFVLPREDAPMVGLYGQYTGDLVFCYEGGYRWTGPEVIEMGEERVVFPCGGGNHGPMVCTYETQTTSVMGTLMLAGPGVRSDCWIPREEQFAYSTTDVAPTIAEILGVEPPAQNEGRVLGEFLTERETSRPDRYLEPLGRPLVYRDSVKPRPKTLKGDVTDEE
ncbi:MAG: alkaline phosphatase family protein [Candidatus Brocadiia bacterium]